MEEFIITNNHIVDDVRTIEGRFGETFNGELNLGKVKVFVEENPNSTLYYFDESLNKKSTGEKGILYCWIDTGYVTQKQEPIFISLVHHDDYFSGHFIGTAQFLANGICNRNYHVTKTVRVNCNKFQKKYVHIMNKRKAQVTMVSTFLRSETSRRAEVSEPMPIKVINLASYKNVEDTKLSPVTEEIYEDIMFPAWKSIYGLDHYIKVIGRRIPQLIKAGKEQYYLKNSLGNVIINTGMMDKFGNDFLILYRRHLSGPEYKPYRLIGGRSCIIEEGFSREQSQRQENIEPISFTDDDNSFDATMEDFDLNTRCLKHIIEERKDRFPETIKGKSADSIAQAVENELKQGLRIHRRDSSYVRQIYSDGKISWYMPFRLEAALTEEPELVLVIRKSNEFYEVKTILPYDDTAKDKITEMSLYRQLW